MTGETKESFCQAPDFKWIKFQLGEGTEHSGFGQAKLVWGEATGLRKSVIDDRPIDPMVVERFLGRPEFFPAIVIWETTQFTAGIWRFLPGGVFLHVLVQAIFPLLSHTTWNPRAFHGNIRIGGTCSAA